MVDAVVAAPAAELVVAARTATGVALFTVPADAPGVARRARPGLDPFRTVDDVELTRAPARLLVAAPAAGPVLIAMRRRAAALLACEAVGVAERALDIAVRHATTRIQFDRPIGSYQAVGHALADCYADVELARSLAYRAAAGADVSVDMDEALACAAQAGRQAAVRVCEAALQVCGGMGVTWEFPLHWWYRRALWLDAWWAGRTDPLDAVADLVLA